MQEVMRCRPTIAEYKHEVEQSVRSCCVAEQKYWITGNQLQQVQGMSKTFMQNFMQNNFRLRQYTLATARNMFYSYVSKKVDEIEELKHTLMETEDEFYAS